MLRRKVVLERLKDSLDYRETLEQNMAVKSVFALFVLFSFTSSCEAKPENCSEARCKLVPVGGGFASEFRLKSSEKGVRLIYLHLKIGNDSYHPLEIKDEFLAERWVWANTINEPMLSLSYDYDILSLGLLTYQVRSINVSLEEQPSGCLASLNASCHNKVVGRALLNETKQSSGEPLHETDVVCVAIIEDAPNFYSNFFEGNVKYHCCGRSKGESAEGSSINCEHIVNSSGWFKAFNGILNILSLVMVFYCPAFYLAVPDFIFNFQEECNKEEQRDKPQEPKKSTISTDKDSRRKTNRPTSRYGSINQSSLDGHSSTDETIPLLTVLSENESIQTDQLSMRSNINISNIEDGQPNPRITAENESIKPELVYLDDASPITLSTFFGQYTKDLPDLIPFNVKLAFLWYCVIPIFVYIKLGLNYAIKREFFEETSKKQEALLVGPLFSFLFEDSFSLIAIVVSPLIVIFFSSPKDFLLAGENVSYAPRCFCCREHTSSIGEDMLKHLGKLQPTIYCFASKLIKLHKKSIKSTRRCTHSCLEKIRPSCKRLKTAFIVAWVLCCNIFFVIFVGVCLAALCFCVFLGGVVLLSLLYSPFISLVLVLGRKTFQIAHSVSQWFVTTKSTNPLILENCFIFFCVFYSIFLILLYIIIQLLFIFYLLLAEVLILAACYIGALSCRFIVRLFGYIIIGLVLNADIASPFVTFFIVASTNMYLCYYNLQKRYGEVKQMISQQWEAQQHILDNTNLSNIEEGAILEDLFWHICGEKSKSEHKVLQISPEIYRMFRNMVLILIFLVLVLCSIIFLGSTYDISSVASTIAVFVSGVIPGLFFKGLTKENSFRGPTKSRMIKEIEKAVKEYIAIKNVRNTLHVRNTMGTTNESQESDTCCCCPI